MKIALTHRIVKRRVVAGCGGRSPWDIFLKFYFSLVERAFMSYGIYFFFYVTNASWLVGCLFFLVLLLRSGSSTCSICCFGCTCSCASYYHWWCCTFWRTFRYFYCCFSVEFNGTQVYYIKENTKIFMKIWKLRLLLQSFGIFIAKKWLLLHFLKGMDG